MSGFLLDTNVLSEFNRTGKPDERVKEWLTATPLASLYVSVITLAEVQFGIELLPPSKRRGRILPVDEDIVRRWAQLYKIRSMVRETRRRVALIALGVPAVWTRQGGRNYDRC